MKPVRANNHWRLSAWAAVGILCLTTLTHLTGSTAVQPGFQDLEQGAAVERELQGGQSHLYRITLASGQFLRGIVEQEEHDLLVTVFDPDHGKIEDFDSRWYGPESVALVAEMSGVHRLEVRSMQQEGTTGRYRVRIEEIRESRPQDTIWVAAIKGSTEGKRLVDVDSGESLKKAIEAYEPALRQWRILGSQQEEAHTFHSIGYVYERLGQPEKALHAYDQALPLYRACGDRQGEASVLQNIGVVYANRGEAQKALDYYQSALELRRAAGDSSGEARLLVEIGLNHVYQGQPERALEYYQQGVSLQRALAERKSEALTLHSIGLAHQSMGQTQQAFEYYQRALQLRRDLGDRRGEAVTLSNMGWIYDSWGEPQKSLEYFKQALPLRRAVGDRRGEAYTRDAMGRTYRKLGRLKEALKLHRQALELRRAVGDRRGEAETLRNIGVVYASWNLSEKALEHYEQALPMVREAGFPAGEAATLLDIGSAYDQLGQSDAALEHLEQALSLFQTIGNRPYEADVLYRLAGVERAKGRLIAATARMKTALEITESFRIEVSNPGPRTSILASSRKYYELYVDLLMELHRREPGAGHDATALHASERARARTLLEMLAEAKANIRQGVDPSLLEQERLLHRRVDQMHIRFLKASRSQEDTSAVEAELRTLLAQYSEIQGEIRSRSPRYAALTQPRPLQLHEIQEQLDGDAVLLEYMLGDQRSYLWVVGRDSLSVQTLPGRAKIEALAQRVHKLLAGSHRRDRRRAAELAAAELSRVVLEPVRGQFRGKRLLIVADGALQYVPFQALPTANLSGGKSGKDGGSVPLLAAQEIVNLPSSSVLSILREEEARRPRAPRAVALIADPVFSSEDPRVQQSARTATGKGGEKSAKDRETQDAVESSQSPELERLRFSRREAEAIEALATGGETLRALGFSASRSAVSGAALRPYRLIHFATHGLLDSQHPELSGIVLSLVDQEGQPQDGFLRMHDLYNLDLNAELVVLSACRTALGKDIKGEGLIGLTRAFMYAGTPRVVASLWDVQDEATAQLMERFYRGILEEGRRPAEALRSAQLSLWKEPRWQAPYYWAGFILQGEYR